MRGVLIAGLFAAIGLGACEPSKPETAAPPPAPKSMARPQQMYAGQEQIVSVGDAVIRRDASGALAMTARGEAASPGYINLGFLRRINAAPPRDGIYEMDVVGDKPAGPAVQAPTPVEVKGAWEGYPADRLKGVKFISKTNSVVAMLPAG
jgi:hypothetical protein